MNQTIRGYIKIKLELVQLMQIFNTVIQPKSTYSGIDDRFLTVKFFGSMINGRGGILPPPLPKNLLIMKFKPLTFDLEGN